MNKTQAESAQGKPPKRRSRWPVIAGSIAGGLLAITALLLLWIINDQDRIRRAVEAGLTGLADREFTIAGDFELTLGAQTTIRATEVSWQNAAYSSQANMLEVGIFTATVNLMSVFDDAIELVDARAEDAVLWFEWPDEGPMNWIFKPATDDKRDTPPDPLPLLLQRARLANTTLYFRHPTLTDILRVDIPRATHRADEQNNLVLDGLLIVDERPINVTGSIGPFPELAMAGDVDFDLQLVGELSRLNAEGGIDWLARFQDPVIDLELLAADAQNLFDRFNLPGVTTGDIDLTAQINLDADNFRIRSQGNLGEFLIDADVETRLDSWLDNLRIAVDSTGPSARRLLSIGGVTGLNDEPYKLEIKARRTEAGLQLDAFTFDTESLDIIAAGQATAEPHARNFDLDLKAAGSDIGDITRLFGMQPRLAASFDVQANIRNNGADNNDLLDASFRIGDITAVVSGEVTESRGQQGSRLRFDLESNDITPLTDLIDLTIASPTSLQLSGDVELESEHINLLSLKGAFPASEFDASGRIDIEGLDRRVALDLIWSGSSLGAAVRRLENAANAPVPDLPFSTTLNIAATADRVSLNNGKLTLGRTTADYSTQVDLAGQVPRVLTSFSATGKDFSELVEQLNITGIKAVDFEAAADLDISASAVRVENARLLWPNGEAGGNVTIGGDDFDQISFDVSATGFNLANAVPDNAIWQPLENRFSLTALGNYARDSIRIETGKASVGASTASISGNLELRPAIRFQDVQLRAEGPRLADLGSINGIALSEKPFSITMLLSGDPGANDLEEIDVQIGQSDLHGEVDFAVTDTVPSINASLASALLDIDDFIIRPEATATPAPPPSGMLLSDEPLPTGLANTFNGSIKADFQSIRLPDLALRNMRIDLDVNQSIAELNALEVSSRLGNFQATGSSRPASAGRSFQLDLTGDAIRFTLADMSEQERAELPLHSLDLSLTAAGNTTRELGASANGYIWLIGGPGKARKFSFGALFGDFATELISAINPLTKPNDFTVVECQNLHFEIDNGVMQTSPAIAIQSDKINILADGKLNLADERIDFGLQTSARKGVGISVGNLVNPFTKVSGTLLTPRISIDEQGTIVQGSAAVATAGLSLFADSLWKRWVSQRNICTKVGEKAIELRTERAPERVPNLAEMAQQVGLAPK